MAPLLENENGYGGVKADSKDVLSLLKFYEEMGQEVRAMVILKHCVENVSNVISNVCFISCISRYEDSSYERRRPVTDSD